MVAAATGISFVGGILSWSLKALLVPRIRRERSIWIPLGGLALGLAGLAYMGYFMYQGYLESTTD